MATMLNFFNVGAPEELRDELRKLAADPQFAWLEDVVAQTAEEFVERSLPAHVERHKYRAWSVEDNIEEAGRVLNNSLDIRAETLSLEAQAIQAALDLQLASQVSQPEAEMARVGYAAAIKQAGLPRSKDADPALSRLSLMQKARETQLAVHNSAGNSLNYGQRVRFLRMLYADNIGMALERLYAVWIGVNAYLGITVEEPPSWSASYDSLFQLVIWLRKVNRLVQEGASDESVTSILVSVRSTSVNIYNAAETEAFYQKLRSGNVEDFKVTLNRASFAGAGPNDAVRLLGVGATLVLGDLHPRFNNAYGGSPDDRSKLAFATEQVASFRQSLGFTTVLEPPVQSSGLAGLAPADRTWNVKPIRLSGVAPWVQSAPEEGIRIYQERQFVNASPVGDWTISIDPTVQTQIGPIAKGDISHALGLAPELQDLFTPIDLVLLLRVGIRGA